MVPAIGICLVLVALCTFEGWRVGRDATSDGDYSFAFWWGLAIIIGLVAVFLTVLAL